MRKNAEQKSGKRAETVHVSVLIDESGSMSGREHAVVTGFNDFLAELRDDEAETASRMSLAMFDLNGDGPVTRVKVDDVPLAEVVDITTADYEPRGMTPLNDAVAKTVRRLDKRVGDNDRAIVVVMTDGYENCSRTPSGKLRKLILAKEKSGWEFIYLGANQDSWAESQKVAMAKAGGSFDFEASDAGIDDAWKVSASRVKTFRDEPAIYEALGAAMSRDVSEERRKQD